MGLLKLLSTSEIFAQVAGFLILLFLLRAFAWKKVLFILDKRKELIKNEFKNIEDSKAELQMLKEEYSAKLLEIEDMANKKLREAVESGRSITEEVRKKAHEEAQKIIENAKVNIKYELLKAKESIKDEIVDIVIKGASQIIEAKLNQDQDRKLVEDFLRKIEKV